jgi:uncharacterized protein (DUF427 family)
MDGGEPLTWHRPNRIVTRPGLTGRGKEQWVFPGIKDHWHPIRSDGSSSPARCPNGCCTPSRYPVAYFPLGGITVGVLEPGLNTTRHRDLGPTSWYTVRAGWQTAQRAAWQHTDLPRSAADLKGRAAFACQAMDAFYEEDERIFGHAADSYHRNDIRQTFCPYKGLCSYYNIADPRRMKKQAPPAAPAIGPLGRPSPAATRPGAPTAAGPVGGTMTAIPGDLQYSADHPGFAPTPAPAWSAPA